MMPTTVTLLWSMFTLEAPQFLVSRILELTLKLITLLCLDYERSKKLTVFGFISNIGGLCGLCLGFSFVSGIEILYWFSLRFFRSFARGIN